MSIEISSRLQPFEYMKNLFGVEKPGEAADETQQ
jgi:hypothetical protein